MSNPSEKQPTTVRKSEAWYFHCNVEGCKKSFNRQWKLDRHLCYHTGERPFPCPVIGCDKSYQCNSHLRRHVKTKHIKEEFVCTFAKCNSSFKTEILLQKHLEDHEKRLLKCSICDAQFTIRPNLEKHELSHVLRYPCPVCGALWTSRTLLRRHMKSHYLIPCDYENCAFVGDSRNTMRAHQKYEHPNVLECAHCYKTFVNKGMLRDHVLSHMPQSDRGVYCCPHIPCKRTYFHMRNLNHHIKVFHNTPRFYCDVENCSSTYTTKAHLLRHKLRRHNVKSKETLMKTLSTIAPIPEDEFEEPREHFLMLVLNQDHV